MPNLFNLQSLLRTHSVRLESGISLSLLSPPPILLGARIVYTVWSPRSRHPLLTCEYRPYRRPFFYHDRRWARDLDPLDDGVRPATYRESLKECQRAAGFFDDRKGGLAEGGVQAH